MCTRSGSAALFAFLLAIGCGNVETPRQLPDAPVAEDAAIDAPPAAQLAIDRTSLSLGSVIVGQTSPPGTLTITNTGAAASGTVQASVTGAGYAIASNGCTGTLAPNATCQVSVTVTPTAPGTPSGALTATATPGGSVTAALTAMALAPGALVANPTSFDFGTAIGGTVSGTTTFTVTNSGGETTGALAVALGGPNSTEFEITSNGCMNMTLAASASCQIVARFRPDATSSGVRSATIAVMATPGGAAVIALTGTSQRPAALALSGMGAFGDTVIGTPVTRTFTVTNGGEQTTGSVMVSRSGSTAFTLLTGMSGDCVSGTTTLMAGTSCNVRVQFNAANPGAVTGMLTVSASPGGSQSSTLTGNGLRPAALQSNPTSNAFGGVEVGVTSSAVTWNIMNTGDVASSVPTLSQTTTELQIAGNTCTAAIPAGGSCSMNVSFRPSAGGARSGSATLSITGSSTTLSTTATGLFRVTVQRAGGGGTITSNPAGISCAPPATSCFGLFVPGNVTLQARTTNASGFFFTSWSGASAGTCANSPNRDCVLDVNGTENLTGTFNAITANLVFVSSATLPTNLGGTAPYDANCNQLATAAGINNTTGSNFIAWISDANSNALTRIGNASGWVRMDGRALATTRANLLGGAILNPVRYSETGAEAGERILLTGTDPNGATASNCTNWSVNNGSAGFTCGGSLAGPNSWTGDCGSSCTASTFSVLCMMRQFTGGTTAATFSGKRVWLTNSPFTVSASASPDTVCTADRPTGVATGRALLARTNATAASLLTATQMYIRPDGQEVGTGNEITAGTPRGGIWQLGNGAYPSTNVRAWTGSTALDQLGTVASTCNNWTDPAPTTGQVGLAEWPRRLFWDFTTQACNSTGFAQARLYCVEP